MGGLWLSRPGEMDWKDKLQLSKKKLIFVCFLKICHQVSKDHPALCSATVLERQPSKVDF